MSGWTRWSTIAALLLATACGADPDDPAGDGGAGGGESGGGGAGGDAGGSAVVPTRACLDACGAYAANCGVDGSACASNCTAGEWSAERRSCIATTDCSELGLARCLFGAACVDMCEHVYEDCGLAFADGSGNEVPKSGCWLNCRGLAESEIACLSVAACEELELCFEEPPG